MNKHRRADDDLTPVEKIHSLEEGLSRGDRARLWLARNGAAGLLFGSVALVGFFAISAADDTAKNAEKIATQNRAAIATSARFDHALRRSQIDSCERSNEIREALRAEASDQIRQTRTLLRSGVYFRLFSGIPRAELRALTKDSIERRQLAIERLGDVDCAAKYPRPAAPADGSAPERPGAAAD